MEGGWQHELSPAWMWGGCGLGQLAYYHPSIMAEIHG